ncbi:MAG: hypothetical protein R3B89_17110 [Polyangiaceae bacterium]
MKERSPLAVRLTPEQIRELDRIAAELSKRAGGVRVSRSAVIRMAIERGMRLLLE